jgi:hypothetical protein
MEHSISRPRGSDMARGLLRELAPDLILLQELNPGSSEALKEAAGAKWMVRAVDLSIPALNGSPVRRRAVAIAGRGPHPCRSWPLDGIRQPERILFIETETEGTTFIAVSYHAPPGVTNRQAAAGSRLRFLVDYAEGAVVVRRRRQYAVDRCVRLRQYPDALAYGPQRRAWR